MIKPRLSSSSKPAARSPSEIAKRVENAAPVRALVTAIDFATILRPGNLRRIEEAAAADERANKTTAQRMRGYKTGAVGLDIKRDLFDSGLLTRAGTVSVKTLVFLAHALVFCLAGLVPFVFGFDVLRGDSTWVGAALMVIGAIAMGMAARQGIEATRNVDATVRAESTRVDPSRGRARNALSGLLGAALSFVDGVARRLAPVTWAGRFAQTHLSDARAFALYAAIADHVLRRNRSWGERVNEICRIADDSGFQSLKRTDIPDKLVQSLAYDGLLPTKRPVGDLQAAMITERHLGAAARVGVAAGLGTAGGSFMVYGPLLLAPLLFLAPWLLAHTMLAVGLASALAITALLAAVAAGAARGIGLFRDQIRDAFANATIDYDIDTAQQLTDAQSDWNDFVAREPLIYSAGRSSLNRTKTL
ncbi:hypothetical protein LA345_12910 [Burkholderia vietnamiensis]|uniref:Uncharacterized protein n=1 Tax=Burkholderia vietnamiensis (strain G4 / LMG 22486) TaxID=269482 RepID=A4JFJ9_BURVG|nr:hypothetical protein Bcep1808_2050 [Burkholderia vietnamiensis G4]MCB4344812.1 hypothetical protein [Burkholderia vietnamiensis]